jgi:uncharacterized protein
VTGPIRAEIYVSADVKDFDLWVRLLDVAPDGTAFNLMSPGLDELRASYRDETVQPNLVEPGKIYRLELNRMLTSNTFLKGHRIRVQISGAFYPHFSRNLQTGESEIYSAEMKVGQLTIHHDAGHRSRIVLPVVGSGGALLSRRPDAPRARRPMILRAASSECSPTGLVGKPECRLAAR